MASKFKGLLDAAKERADEQPPEEAPIVPTPRQKRGKSADPAYMQAPFYIRKETHRQLKIKLLQTGDERDMSDVVEELLQGWLQAE